MQTPRARNQDWLARNPKIHWHDDSAPSRAAGYLHHNRRVQLSRHRSGQAASHHAMEWPGSICYSRTPSQPTASSSGLVTGLGPCAPQLLREIELIANDMKGKL